MQLLLYVATLSRRSSRSVMHNLYSIILVLWLKGFSNIMSPMHDLYISGQRSSMTAIFSYVKQYFLQPEHPTQVSYTVSFVSISCNLLTCAYLNLLKDLKKKDFKFNFPILVMGIWACFIKSIFIYKGQRSTKVTLFLAEFGCHVLQYVIIVLSRVILIRSGPNSHIENGGNMFKSLLIDNIAQ